jgi:hypothetical protein
MKRKLQRAGLVVAAIVALAKLAPDAIAQAIALFQGVIVGTASSQTGFLDLYSSGAAFKTRIQAADTPTAAVTWKLPAADLGATGFLQSNGSGVLSLVGFPFADNINLLKDDGDSSKLLQFQLSGITTANTVTLNVAGTAASPYLLLGGNTTAFNAWDWNTTQTPDTGMLLTGSTGNSWIIAEQADRGFDFAVAARTDPTLVIQSHNQSTSERMMLYHNATFGVLENFTGNGIIVKISGNPYVSLGANVEIANNGYFAGSSTTDATSTPDTFWGRGPAAASWVSGQDVNGAPVDQTIKAHNGITGTNIKGAALILESGIGTGSAVSNPFTINRQIVKASGTTAQTYAPAMIVCPTKILSNTSATAQTIATITTTSTTAGTVSLLYTTTASNGTVLDADSGMVNVSWNNNAGTVAAAMTAVVMQSDSDASGTLATTPTATVATNVVSIKFTPTWVTIVPTTVTGYATFIVNDPGDTVACQ